MGVIWASYWAQGRYVIDWGGTLQLQLLLLLQLMLQLLVPYGQASLIREYSHFIIHPYQTIPAS